MDKLGVKGSFIKLVFLYGFCMLLLGFWTQESELFFKFSPLAVVSCFIINPILFTIFYLMITRSLYRRLRSKLAIGGYFLVCSVAAFFLYQYNYTYASAVFSIHLKISDNLPKLHPFSSLIDVILLYSINFIIFCALGLAILLLMRKIWGKNKLKESSPAPK